MFKNLKYKMLHLGWGNPRYVIELYELEGTLKGHLVQLPCNEQGQLQLHQVLTAPYSLSMAVCRDGAATTSLSNPFQYFTTLTVKKIIKKTYTRTFSLYPGHISSFQLKLLPLVLSQQTLTKSLPPFFFKLPFRY